MQCRQDEYVRPRDFAGINKEDNALGDYIELEGFEKYNDTSGNEVWTTLLDGFGIDDNGSQIGHSLAPYMEQYIVRNGRQSAPL